MIFSCLFVTFHPKSLLLHVFVFCVLFMRQTISVPIKLCGMIASDDVCSFLVFSPSLMFSRHIFALK